MQIYLTGHDAYGSAFVGYSTFTTELSTFKFENCNNYGNLTTTKNISLIIGNQDQLIAIFDEMTKSITEKPIVVEINNCKNFGEINAGDSARLFVSNGGQQTYPSYFSIDGNRNYTTNYIKTNNINVIDNIVISNGENNELYIEMNSLREKINKLNIINKNIGKISINAYFEGRQLNDQANVKMYFKTTEYVDNINLDKLSIGYYDSKVIGNSEKIGDKERTLTNSNNITCVYENGKYNFYYGNEYLGVNNGKEESICISILVYDTQNNVIGCINYKTK